MVRRGPVVGVVDGEGDGEGGGVAQEELAVVNVLGGSGKICVLIKNVFSKPFVFVLSYNIKVLLLSIFVFFGINIVGDKKTS